MAQQVGRNVVNGEDRGEDSGWGRGVLSLLMTDLLSRVRVQGMSRDLSHEARGGA